MRNRFDEQLFELNREIIEMGALCEEAISNAVKALVTGDVVLAGSIKEKDNAIDQKERDIENRCMKLLLHQQPVARDLRLISAALKMITDMERIGDQAEDIAEIVTFLAGHTLNGMEQINEMAQETAPFFLPVISSEFACHFERSREILLSLYDYGKRFSRYGCSVQTDCERCP